MFVLIMYQVKYSLDVKRNVCTDVDVFCYEQRYILYYLC